MGIDNRTSPSDHNNDNKVDLDKRNISSDLDGTVVPQHENKQDKSTTSISSDGLVGMMHLLFQRGYFQQHDPKQSHEEFQSVPTALYQDKKDFVQPTYFSHHTNSESSDGNCIIPESFFNAHSALVPLIKDKNNLNNNCESYATTKVLVEQFRQLVCNNELRWTISDISTILRISIPTIIHNILPTALQENFEFFPTTNLQQSSSSKCENVKNSRIPLFLLVHDNRFFPSIHLPSQSPSIPSTKDDLTSILSILNGQSHVIPDQYFSMAFDFLCEEIVSNKELSGCLTLSYVCDKVYKLPKTVVIPTLTVQFDRQRNKICNDDDDKTLLQLKQTVKGHQVVISQYYWEDLRRKVVSAFAMILDAEVSLREISSDNGWDLSWVSEIVRQACDMNQLPATVIMRSDEVFYRPNQFDNHQRKQLWDYYNLKGYLTSHYAKKYLHISSTSQMNYFIQHQFEATRQIDDTILAPIVVNETIFHPTILLEPLRLSIQDAVSKSSWTNITQIIPPELLEQQRDDILTLLKQFVLVREHCTGSSALDLSDGMLCVEGAEALYFSKGMIAAYTKNRLPIIGESFAKARANIISEQRQQSETNADGLEDDVDVIDDKTAIPSGKEKLKQRKELKMSKQASKRKNEGQNAHEFDDDDSLELVGMIIQDLFNEFSELEEAIGLPTRKHKEEISKSTILQTFCRQTFVSDKLKMSINRILLLELEEKMKLIAGSCSILTHRSKSFSVQSIGPYLSDIHEIQQSFEDPSCFATSCFMVQSAYKVLLYAKEILVSSSDATIIHACDVENLEKEFLTGCCADFTRRLTQYALQKNDTGDPTSIIIRRTSCDDIVGQELPYYYDSVNIGIRGYSKVCLCTVNNTNPLTTLRDSLPRSIGVALARQWMLCGGESYHGGVMETSDGTISRPGDCEMFMQHIHENCLPVCGIPFSKLEKKAEKKFLSDRKQILIRCIEEITDDANFLYELTIMLLYQSVKNLVVFGSHLQGPILQMLLKERKISQEVRDALLFFGQKLRDSDTIDNSMIDTMKAVALGKDGTKKK